jgi:MerR family transcriptional regulator, light-induced transcriptional regulator
MTKYEPQLLTLPGTPQSAVARSPSHTQQTLKSISEVERDTGLPRATIRIWERRYGFPAPERDERGERCYAPEQVEQLGVMRQLVEQGHRPARLLAMGLEEMKQLAGGAPRPARRTAIASPLLRLLREHDAVAVQAELEAMLAKRGLSQFAGVDVPALNTLVGDAWLAGELQIHEEHLYSDSLYRVMHPAIRALEAEVRPEAPRVLLTTFPNEPHGLGLLMAQAMFALQGCATVSLGVRLPLDQIEASVRAYRADLVGLSFTGTQNPTHVLRGLEELRGRLPTAVRIWAGGSSPALSRRPIPGVRVIQDVAAIPHYLAEDFALPPKPAR